MFSQIFTNLSIYWQIDGYDELVTVNPVDDWKGQSMRTEVISRLTEIIEDYQGLSWLPERKSSITNGCHYQRMNLMIFETSRKFKDSAGARDSKVQQPTDSQYFSHVFELLYTDMCLWLQIDEFKTMQNSLSWTRKVC